MTIEPLDVATADVIARYKKGNDMLTSAAIALRKLRERVEAGEAGPDWDWPRYCAAHLTPHMSQRWIRKQLQLAPPGATADQVQGNIDRHREAKAAQMRDQRQREATPRNHVVPQLQREMRLSLDTALEHVAQPEVDPLVFPEFPEEAEAIEKEGAPSLIVHAVRRGFITYSHALKLMRRPPESQERLIGIAEGKWLKAKREQEQIHERACIETAVKLLADRLVQDFGRFVDLLRRADFFSDDTVFSEALHVEAQKRGILIDEEDEDVEEATPPSMAA